MMKLKLFFGVLGGLLSRKPNPQAIVSMVLVILAWVLDKLVPDSTIESFGRSVGTRISAEMTKYGDAWENTEDELETKFGRLFLAIRAGLDADDPTRALGRPPK